eukprot:581930_1
MHGIALTPHQSNPMHSHSEYTNVKEPTSAEPEQELREEEEYMQEALDVKKVGYAVNESAALFMTEAYVMIALNVANDLVWFQGITCHEPCIAYHQRNHWWKEEMIRHERKELNRRN